MKNPPRFRKMARYEVKWHDAASYSEKSWFGDQDIKELTKSVLTSLGYYHSTHNGEYHFVGCKDLDNKDMQYSRHMSIPIAMLVSVKELVEKK